MENKDDRVTALGVLTRLDSRQRKYANSLTRESKRLIHRYLGGVLARLLSRTPDGGLLNLGCGPCYFDGWVNAEYHYVRRFFSSFPNSPDWFLDATQHWRCPDNHWSGIFTEHMLEHLAYEGAINVLREAFRTLKPASWVRVIVPDLSKAVRFYSGIRPIGYEHPRHGKFHYGIESIFNLTQCWTHISVWDAIVLADLLTEIGFINVKEVAFREGTDSHLLRDSEQHGWESVYVEAQKPGGK